MEMYCIDTRHITASIAVVMPRRLLFRRSSEPLVARQSKYTVRQIAGKRLAVSLAGSLAIGLLGGGIENCVRQREIGRFDSEY